MEAFHKEYFFINQEQILEASQSLHPFFGSARQFQMLFMRYRHAFVFLATIKLISILITHFILVHYRPLTI